MKALSIITALFFITIGQASAKVNFIEALVEKSPSVIDDSENGKLLDCFTCHTVDKWQRNDFGLELQAEIRAEYTAQHGQAPTVSTVYDRDLIKTALTKIEDTDSDGDGYTNKVEIESNHCPGDYKDYPGVADSRTNCKTEF